jgi:hypothetical protein
VRSTEGLGLGKAQMGGTHPLCWEAKKRSRLTRRFYPGTITAAPSIASFLIANSASFA